MGLEDQAAVKRVADELGGDVVVLLGTPDAESTQTLAQRFNNSRRISFSAFQILRQYKPQRAQRNTEDFKSEISNLNSSETSVFLCVLCGENAFAQPLTPAFQSLHVGPARVWWGTRLAKV